MSAPDERRAAERRPTDAPSVRPNAVAWRWAPRVVVLAAATLAVVAFVAHAWQAVAGAYLSYVSGIWLALGHDLASGVFYRPLIGPLGYGGTRYFPLFFCVIGLLQRAGVPPLESGWQASAVAGAMLATGLARCGRAVGAPRPFAWLLGAAAIAPYFVQQTLFEVRADVLAAGLNLWGLAAIIPAWRGPDSARPRTVPATAWFTLAFAAKVTSLSVPLSVLAALLVSGRLQTARRLGAQLAVGLVMFFGVVEIASAGRAIESWRACMFAGSSQESTLMSLLRGDFLELAGFSHLLTVLLFVTVLALIAAVVLSRRPINSPPRSIGIDSKPSWLDGRALWLPALLFAGVTATTALTLSSPGTVPSNQVVEWVQVSLVVLTWVAASHRELTRPLSVLVVLIVLWMSAQDLIRVRALVATRSERTSADVRDAIAQYVGSTPAPVLAESALWPVLAGRHAYLLDPFALRVVMQTRPDIAQDLEHKIDAHYFASVIFQVDPTSGIGRGYYEHVNFGWPSTARILERYRFDRRPASDVWIYVPKAPSEQ